MLTEASFSRLERNYLWLLLGLLVFSFFYQLGIYPLFLEEPRRGLIALEMMYRDNYWVPTQTGDLYLRKPPFYNWVLIIFYKIFGPSEFATRFVSVSSHLILGGITYFFGRKYLGEKAAILTSLSYLVTVDILVYFSTLGEIDLFYALITGLSIFFMFHFGEKKRYFKLFIAVYFLTAIGFLTKGLSALPYTAISLLVYFIWNKDFKKLISLAHFAGILVFALVLAGYFFKYGQYEELDGWWKTLFSESADKAAGGGFAQWLNHFLSFPLDTLKNLIPAAFLLPFMFSKNNMKDLKTNSLGWFSFLVFVFNFLIYWFSTEGRSRYIYPIFPFACIVFVLLFIQSNRAWKTKYLRVLAFVITGVLFLGYAAIPFIESLDTVDNLWLVSITGLLLLSVLGLLLIRKQVRPYLVVLGLLVVLRLGFSAIVPQTREKTTGAAEDKALGLEIAEITKGESLKRIGDVRISLTVVFYIERGREDVLYQTDEFLEGFYLCYEEDLPKNYEIVRELDYHGEPIFLIRYLP